MLWMSPSMWLPSLSSIVGDAGTLPAKPSSAAAIQAWINIFMGTTLRTSVGHASYYSQKLKSESARHHAGTSIDLEPVLEDEIGERFIRADVDLAVVRPRNRWIA